jgi:hypothetical protein
MIRESPIVSHRHQRTTFSMRFRSVPLPIRISSAGIDDSLTEDRPEITLVFILFVLSGDLLNQADNGSPEFRVLDAHVGLRECKPVRRG